MNCPILDKCRPNPTSKGTSDGGTNNATLVDPRASHTPIIDKLNTLKNVLSKAIHKPSDILLSFDEAGTFGSFNADPSLHSTIDISLSQMRNGKNNPSPPPLKVGKEKTNSICVNDQIASQNFPNNKNSHDEGNLPPVSESHPIVCDLDVAIIEVIKAKPNVSNQTFSTSQAQAASKYDLTRTNPLFEDSDGDQLSFFGDLVITEEHSDEQHLPKSMDSVDGYILSTGGEVTFTKRKLGARSKCLNLHFQRETDIQQLRSNSKRPRPSSAEEAPPVMQQRQERGIGLSGSESDMGIGMAAFIDPETLDCCICMEPLSSPVFQESHCKLFQKSRSTLSVQITPLQLKRFYIYCNHALYITVIAVVFSRFVVQSTENSLWKEIGKQLIILRGINRILKWFRKEILGKEEIL
ncbi:hypothetical protein SUGI_0110090 [Cryptomeria japonica]|nr:hypothetical protein SUGI_0110090 [Cryptomeria japonica]